MRRDAPRLSQWHRATVILDSIDKAEELRLFCAHEIVAIERLRDSLFRLARVKGVNLVEALAYTPNLVGANYDVRRHALQAASSARQPERSPTCAPPDG